MKINFTADNGMNMENWFQEKTKKALNASMKLAEHFDGTGDMNEIVYDLLWDVVYPLCMISGMCYGVNTLSWDDVKEVFEKGVSGVDAFLKNWKENNMDCKLCYRYLKCWACDEWLGCKGKKAEADCFVCDQAACPERTGDARPYEEVGE